MLASRMNEAPTVPPRWLAILAGGSLAVVVAIAGVSTFRVFGAQSANLAPQTAREVSSLVPPTTAALPGAGRVKTWEWANKLLDTTCETPCLGGSACATTGNKPCASRYSCIPGDRDDRLEGEMPLNLYLAALVGREGKSEACTSLKRASVCFTPASSNRETCVPLADACTTGRSTTPVPIVARDLVSEGVALKVRMETGRKPVVLTGKLEYGTPLRRVGLCTGFKAGGLVGSGASDVKFITFFLEPRATEAE